MDTLVDMGPALLSSVLKAMQVGIIVLDDEERVVLWNYWMEQHSFHSAESVRGKSFTELFPDLANGRAHHAIKGALKNNFSSLLSQTLNKSPFPVFASPESRAIGARLQQAVQIMPLEFPSKQHCIIQITDVSMAVAREKQLRELAVELQSQIFIDGLTGIPNRRRFDEHMDSEFRWAKRAGAPLSLIMIDVDSFKNYNDNYGHQKGDECLITIATTLSSIIERPCDLIARYGGEEFIAILPNTDSAGAALLAECMRSEVESLAIEHAYSSVADYVTISLGVTTQTPSQTTTIADIIGGADQALYQAKHNGRNCFMVYGNKADDAKSGVPDEN